MRRREAAQSGSKEIETEEKAEEEKEEKGSGGGERRENRCIQTYKHKQTGASSLSSQPCVKCR